MKNNNRVIEALQAQISEDEVKNICRKNKYIDTARKFTVYRLVEYFVAAAVGEWNSFRAAEINGASYKLIPIDYSTFSKKASEVDYNITKELYKLLVKKINRETKRALKLNKYLDAVDSTTISFGKTTRLWAEYRKTKAGIKLHVTYNVSSGIPTNAEESNGKVHDSKMLESVINPENILVADRGYLNLKRFDKFTVNNQLFVIRIKDSIIETKKHQLKRLVPDETNVTADYTCLLGTEESYITENRVRIVVFNDTYGNEIKVCTNMLDVSSEVIALIYKKRWAVESFFRFMKQHLNIKNLFGTTENAVYNQLFCALIAYIVLYETYKAVSKKLVHTKLSMVDFIRKMINGTFNTETLILLFDYFANE